MQVNFEQRGRLDEIAKAPKLRVEVVGFEADSVHDKAVLIGGQRKAVLEDLIDLLDCSFKKLANSAAIHSLFETAAAFISFAILGPSYFSGIIG